MNKFIIDIPSDWTVRMLILLTAILMFIFSLPHVIALRHVLLIVAVMVAFKYFWAAVRQYRRALLAPVLLLLVLQFWMLFISAFIAKHPLSSFDEWAGQWLPVFMTFIIGVGLAYALQQASTRHSGTIVVLLILLPITCFLIANAVALFQDSVLTGKFLHEQHQLGITDQKSVTSYLIALLEPLLIADIFNRFVKRDPSLLLPSWMIPMVLLLSIFCLVAATSRNGLIFMLLTFVLGVAMMFRHLCQLYSAHKIMAFVITGFFLIAAFSLAAYYADPRWQNFVETVPVAWDIDHDLLWLSSDYSNLPSTSNGTQVELSAYNRIAWAHEGIRMLLEHPWGIEISRYTFHNLELAKYGHAGMWHSHNSWLDMGLNVGFPGLLLWAAFLALLIHKGWCAWSRLNNPFGLALVILVVMFALRGLFDSIFRDHMTQQFVLVASLLLGAFTFFNEQPHHAAAQQ